MSQGYVCFSNGVIAEVNKILGLFKLKSSTPLDGWLLWFLRKWLREKCGTILLEGKCEAFKGYLIRVLPQIIGI